MRDFFKFSLNYAKTKEELRMMWKMDCKSYGKVSPCMEEMLSLWTLIRSGKRFFASQGSLCRMSDV